MVSSVVSFPKIENIVPTINHQSLYIPPSIALSDMAGQQKPPHLNVNPKIENIVPTTINHQSLYIPPSIALSDMAGQQKPHLNVFVLGKTVPGFL